MRRTVNIKSKAMFAGHVPRVFTRRALMFGAGQLGLFGLLAARLYKIQLVEGRKYKQLADDNRTYTQLLAPVRGRIVDRSGALIASNNENLRLLVIPDQTRDLGRTLAEAGAIVTISARTRARVIKTAARQNPQWPILLAEKLDWRQFAMLNAKAPEIAGIRTDIGHDRHYLKGPEFAHITGFVGAASRIDLARHSVLRLPGLRIGKSGVEKGFEKTLRGEPGNVVWQVNAKGRIVGEVTRTLPQPGAELRLTVDSAMQSWCLRRLAGHRRAVCVALDAVSGDIMALASHPTFDPNAITFGISKSAWQKIRNAEDDPLTNRAIRGEYPPGSTFKMVTALAGLEAGVMSKRDRFSCSGVYRLKKQRYHCWKRKGHGRVDLHRALKSSCDVYFYNVARRVGIDRLKAMANRLGLGVSYDCGLPTQKSGLMPDKNWKRAVLNKNWYVGETVLAGIGQGYVLATPLQLAVMTARIATGRKIVPAIGRSKQQPVLPRAEKLGIRESDLNAVRKGMFAVVNERGGTATGAALNIMGASMAGKTGTSQVRSNKGPGRKSIAQMKWEHRPHALFVAYAPADKPRYAVAVVVEHGGSGSRVAAPIARDVLRELLQRDPVAKSPKKPAPPTPRERAEKAGRQKHAG